MIDIKLLIYKIFVKKFSKTTATELDKDFFLIDEEIWDSSVDFKL